VATEKYGELELFKNMHELSFNLPYSVLIYGTEGAAYVLVELRYMCSSLSGIEFIYTEHEMNSTGPGRLAPEGTTNIIIAFCEAGRSE